jgi:hypothetical protein
MGPVPGKSGGRFPEALALYCCGEVIGAAPVGDVHEQEISTLDDRLVQRCPR